MVNFWEFCCNFVCYILTSFNVEYFTATVYVFLLYDGFNELRYLMKYMVFNELCVIWWITIDYERVINYHTQQGCFKEALKVLSTSVGSPKLFYKFSPLLMQHIPTATVDAWIEKGKNLQPKRLIPSLIQCNQPAAAEPHQVILLLPW